MGEITYPLGRGYVIIDKSLEPGYEDKWISWIPQLTPNLWRPPKKEKRGKEEGTKIATRRKGEGYVYSHRLTGDPRADTGTGFYCLRYIPDTSPIQQVVNHHSDACMVVVNGRGGHGR